MWKVLVGLGGTLVVSVIFASAWISNLPHETEKKVREYPALELVGSELRTQKTPVLLVHGLNFDTEKMRSLAGLFNQEGHTVGLVTLTGHRKDFEETRTVDIESWKQDLIKAANELKGQNGELICSGFSLGGLLLVTLHAEGLLHCSKFTLFAPALEAHVPTSWGLLGTSLIPSFFKIPSAIPVGYRRHNFFSTSQTHVLFEWISRFQKQNDFSRLRSVPGLVLMDPEDELVSWESVQMRVNDFGRSWRLEPLSTNGTLNKTRHHHLITDQNSVGIQEWSRVQSLIQSWLSAE